MIRLERSVWRTLAALFAATYALQACALLRGGPGSPGFTVWVGASMFLPGLFALLHLRRSGDGWRSIAWRLGSLRHLGLSLTLPAVLTLIAVGLCELTGLGHQPIIVTEADGSLSADLPLIVEAKGLNHLAFALDVIASGVLYSLIVGVMTMGEEIGWRGWLQVKLLERNGLFRSVVFLGLLWAAWHAPLILGGFNYERTPVLGAFLFFPVAVVGVSGWIAWLTIRSGSVWPAVFFHAGVNSVGVLAFEIEFDDRDALGQLALSGGLLLSGLTVLWWGVARGRTQPA